MKFGRRYTVVLALLGLAATWQAHAQTSAAETQALARQKNCMTCHAVSQPLLGPSFRDVARRYARQPGSEDLLAKKIINGGAGAWGPTPMPANTQVSQTEAHTLAHWIMSFK